MVNNGHGTYRLYREEDRMMKIFKNLLAACVLLIGLISQGALATPNDKPTQSVMGNGRADNLGIFADNEVGISECWRRLSANTVLFYRPTDVRGFDVNARTAPLEADTCARMRVRGGLIGVVALREGSLMNLGQRDGREQPVAYNICNNWLELLARPVVAIAPVESTLPVSSVTVNTTSTNTIQTVENVVTIRRVTRYVYEDVVEGPPPSDVVVNVPPTEYRYVQVSRPTVQTQAAQQCVCYRPLADTTSDLYRYRYPDGNLYCVPRYMGDRTEYPPGYGTNR